MPLAKSITLKRINVLGGLKFFITGAISLCFISAYSQDNSPYSRYGLGNMTPSSNINSRGMGGISAAYNEWLAINYSNPASYGMFQTVKEPMSKRISYGRAILDVGINIENRMLREPNSTEKFTASNFLVSHIMLGVPIKQNWGLAFGIRPLTRVSYNIATGEKNTSGDSVVTLAKGDGGAYLPTIGTGVRIPMGKTQSLSLGGNIGYLFGQKDISTRRAILNDSLAFTAGNFQTKTSYGNLYWNAGLQYQINFKKGLFLTLGLSGAIKQDLRSKQDIIRETYFYDESSGFVRLDSVHNITDVKGTITYPGSYTAGVVLEQWPQANKAGWLIGVDFVQNKWNDFTFYGVQDPNIKNNWELRVGGQIRPSIKRSYLSNVLYRGGFFFGPDYIYAKQQELPVWGATLGLGLPLRNTSRQSPGQATLINMSFEYIKRGNNDNLLKENLFRLSVGLCLSDFWFVKKKYE